MLSVEPQNVQRKAARATLLWPLTPLDPLTIFRLAEMCLVNMYAPPADQTKFLRLESLGVSRSPATSEIVPNAENFSPIICDRPNLTSSDFGSDSPPVNGQSRGFLYHSNRGTSIRVAKCYSGSGGTFPNAGSTPAAAIINCDEQHQRGIW